MHSKTPKLSPIALAALAMLYEALFSHHQDNEDGSVTAFFEDGSKSTGHVLVGADGTGSGVRKQRLPQARLEETGTLSIAGKLPLTAESRAAMLERLTNPDMPARDILLDCRLVIRDSC